MATQIAKRRNLAKSVGSFSLKRKTLLLVLLSVLPSVFLTTNAFAFATTVDRAHPEDLLPSASLPGALNSEWIQAEMSSYQVLTSGAVSLLEYIRANVDPIDRDELKFHVPRYNRQLHFGEWIDADRDCIDTRNEVLLRDSDPNNTVTFHDQRQCMVAKGVWKDPYSGRPFKLARSIQIDHVVPLHNAYYSGAFTWQPAQRCHYANYLENQFHLRAVSGHENMTKSSKGPEKYMPPNDKFACQYLHEWMKIKAIWELTVSQDELDSIEVYLQAFGCRANHYAVDRSELALQRALTVRVNKKCLIFEDKISQAVVIPGLPFQPRKEDSYVDIDL